MKLRKLILAMFLSFMVILQTGIVTYAAPANNALTWKVKDDRSGRSFSDITTFNNKLIAVGANGLIMVSNDGSKWSQVKVDTKAHFVGVVTDGKKAVAATNDGNVFISADGENWNVKSIAVGVSVYSIRFLNNKYVLLGPNFTVMFSDDGIKWTDMAKDYEGTKYNIAGAAYNPDNGDWVLGEESTLIVTKDFKTFDEYTLPKDVYLVDIGYLNGRYIIGSLYGYIFDTVDFKNFNKSDKFSGSGYLENFNNIKIINNYFLALGQQGFLVQGTNASDAKEIKYDVNDKYGATGLTIFNYDYYITNWKGSIEKSSSSSSSWSTSLNGTFGDIQEVIPVEDKFLAYTRDDIFLLNADYTLKKVASPNGTMSAYSFTDGKYEIKGSGYFTASSLDLINWDVNTNAANDFVVNDATEYNNMFYVISGGGGQTIRSGIAYYDNSNGYKSLVESRFQQNSFEVFNDKLISIGNYGEGYIVDKSNNYQKININKETSYKVRYLNGNLIAINPNGRISISTDGINWVTKTIDSKLSFHDIAYGNGLYVLVGNNGTILTSSDLNAWYKNDSTVGNNLTSIAFNNEKFVIGGAQNTFLVSDNTTVSNQLVKSQKVKFDPTKIYVYVDNKEVTFDQEPIIKDGRTLAPLRKVFEALGAKVEWDDATRTVTATKDDVVIKVQIGNTTAYVNNDAVTLDVPAEIENGRTLVPLRFISESLNSKVTWEDFSRSIYIDEQ